MISGDFSAQGELRKIFTLSFPARQGNRRGGAALPASAPLGPSRPGTRVQRPASGGVAVVAASAPAHKRFGEQPVWSSRNG